MVELDVELFGKAVVIARNSGVSIGVDGWSIEKYAYYYATINNDNYANFHPFFCCVNSKTGEKKFFDATKIGIPSKGGKINWDNKNS